MHASRWTTFALLPLVLLVALAWPGRARAQDDGPTVVPGLGPYLQVKTWRLRVTWTAGLHTNQGDATRTITQNADIVAQADFKLVRDEDADPDAVFKWRQLDGDQPTGNMNYHADEKIVDKNPDGTTSWSEEKYLAGGVVAGDGRFEIRPRTGEYAVNGYFRSGPLTMEGTDSYGHHSKTTAPFMVLPIQQTVRGPEDWTGQVPVPAADSANPVIRAAPRAVICTVPLIADGKRTITMSWTLTPWDKEPGEATFELADSKWVPDPHDHCIVVVGWKGHAEKVRATLTHVTRVPGTCMNSTEGGSELDLYLPKQSPWVVADDSLSATLEVTKPEDKAATFDLAATDYAAYGKLNVDVMIAGVWKHATDKQSGATVKTVPTDDDDNSLADGWEEKEGLSGIHAMDDDDDTPDGDGSRHGDGLTAWEEYRGFMEHGDHIRTSPKVMDLFLSDQTGGQAAAGVRYFEGVSQIRVHEQLTADELGESRVVNRNHNSLHKVDQHGIPIVMGPEKSTAEAVAETPGKGYGPPVMTAKINLPSGRSYARPAKGAASNETEDNIITLAHELGHCVGIAHHAEGVRYVKWYQMQTADGQWETRESDFDPGSGKVLKNNNLGVLIRVFRESAGPGGPPEVAGGTLAAGEADKVNGKPTGMRSVLLALRPSPYAGQENCIMRYTDPDAYVVAGQPGNYRFLPPLNAPWVKRDVLCESATGTGINASDHAPWPRYGDGAQRGCKQQIVVSDLWAP